MSALCQKAALKPKAMAMIQTLAQREIIVSVAR
jgi:hypothetical protein